MKHGELPLIKSPPPSVIVPITTFGESSAALTAIATIFFITVVLPDDGAPVKKTFFAFIVTSKY
jgi:hypothetical protein